MFHINVQGINSDVDSATSEDIWTNGGTYPFPSSAAITTIESSSANDTSAGTGARTVKITGLNSEFRLIHETVTLNGTNPVTMINSFYRINLIEVMSAGSGNQNAGALSVKHGATVIGHVVTGKNRSQSAVFTCPVNARNWLIEKIYVAINNATNGTATVELYTRKVGYLWQPRWAFAVHGTAKVSDHVYIPASIYLETGEDIRLHCTVTADNTSVIGGFDIIGGSAAINS